jgi:hypothetical protein
MQAHIRGFLARKQFKETMDHYARNMDKIIKIQSLFRGKAAEDAYKALSRFCVSWKHCRLLLSIDITLPEFSCILSTFKPASPTLLLTSSKTLFTCWMIATRTLTRSLVCYNFFKRGMFSSSTVGSNC